MPRSNSESGVTVVIPAYKAEKWLTRTIDSIFEQRQLDTEVIVVEDGEYDNTAGVLERWPRVRHIKLAINQGSSHARNIGLHAANKSYVLFLDADDFIEPPLLASLRNAIEAAGADMCFGPWRFGADGAYHRDIIQPADSSDSEHWIAGLLSGKKRFWSWPGRILWRKSFIEAIGGWSETLAFSDDDELMLRALTHKAKVATAATGCGVYWQHHSESRKTVRAFEARQECRMTLAKGVGTSLDNDMIDAAIVRPALARHCYRHAKTEFSRGCDDRARRWLALARRYGVSGHIGSPAHRLTSTVLGLKSKERISRRYHELRSVLRTVSKSAFVSKPLRKRPREAGQ